MKKHLRLVGEYLSGSGMQLILLLLLSYIAIVVSLLSYATVRNAEENYAAFGADRFADMYYFNMLDDSAFYPYESMTDYGQILAGDHKVYAFQDAIAEMPGVEYIVTCPVGLVSVYRFPDETMKLLQNGGKPEILDYREYCYFAKVRLVSREYLRLFERLSAQMPFDNEDDAYLCGPDFPKVAPGETLTLVIGEGATSKFRQKGKLLDFQIAGSVDPNGLFPQFSSSSTALSVDTILVNRKSDLYSEERNTIYLLDTPRNREWAGKYLEDVSRAKNFYLHFREDASEAEKEAVVSEVQKYGILHPLKELANEVKADLREVVRKQLPRAVLMVMLSLLAYISLIVVMVSKKQKESAIGWLCGSTKRQGLGIALSALSLVTLPATLAGIFGIFLIRSAERTNSYLFYGMLFDDGAYYLVIAYWLLTLLITTVLTTVLFSGSSPIKQLRRTRA